MRLINDSFLELLEKGWKRIIGGKYQKIGLEPEWLSIEIEYYTKKHQMTLILLLPVGFK